MAKRRFSPCSTHLISAACATICLVAATPALAQLAQEAFVKANNTGSSDGFGYAVAISGTTMVIGAKDEDSNKAGIFTDTSGDNDSGDDSGAAYVYVWDGGAWVFQAYLKASNTGDEDEFGSAVAISGNTIIVGAPDESSSAQGINGDQANNGANRSGAVYVFTRSGSTWTQQAYIKPSNTTSDQRFGSAVDIDGDTLVAGAWGDESLTGAAYVFARNAGTWAEQEILKASNKAFFDGFGISVAIDGDLIAVGARNRDGDGTPDSGAAYVFARNGTDWTEEAFIESSNPDNPVGDPEFLIAGQQFGWAVDISGNTLAVGAPLEASPATGINGDQTTATATQAGAVYVFLRNAPGDWVQTTYIKASNTNAYDRFGQSVSLQGDTLAVGAPQESGNAKGIDGDQGNNSLPSAGAVYVFERAGKGNWGQSYYVKASNTALYYSFGYSTALDSGRMLVGSIAESSSDTGVGDGKTTDSSAPGAGAAYVFTGLPSQLAFQINAGVNDAWVSEDAPFQGFFFTVFDQLQLMFLSWFTFDTVAPGGQVVANFGAADQRWVTASGTINGDTATLTIEKTSGGIFNSNEMIATQDPAYGTITIKFINCNEAIVTFNIPSLGISGQFTATRVLTSNVALCEVMQ